METLQIEKQNAIAAYQQANANGKKLLAKLLGEKNLYDDITDRVNSVLDALDVLGMSLDEIRPYKNPINSRQEAVNATEEIFVIAEALQEGWVADYSDGSQKKWYVWLVWDKTASAFRFYDAHYDYTGALAGSGARLSFPTEKLAKHFCKIAITQYNKILTK